jgi:hypothetical protein
MSNVPEEERTELDWFMIEQHRRIWLDNGTSSDMPENYSNWRPNNSEIRNALAWVVCQEVRRSYGEDRTNYPADLLKWFTMRKEPSKTLSAYLEKEPISRNVFVETMKAIGVFKILFFAFLGVFMGLVIWCSVIELSRRY